MYYIVFMSRIVVAFLKANAALYGVCSLFGPFLFFICIEEFMPTPFLCQVKVEGKVKGKQES